MSESGGFNEEINLPGGSFSRLLLSADDIIERSSNFHNNVFSNNHNHHNNINSSPSPLFSNNTPKMLCFGDFTSQTSSSSSFAMPNSSTLPHHNHNKRRNGSGQESGLSAFNVQKNVKKKNKQEMEPKTITTNLVRHAKGKRVKLGERINSLQQLVCPYGKTDTASVLHEAIGYIRFLQDQVKVLSSPYLQHLSRSSPLPSPQHPLSFTENRLPNSANTYDPTEGLRSRGLCLVPVKCIDDIADINGADFWSSATSLSTSLTTTSTVVASRNSS